MSEMIKNRSEILFLYDVTNSNPNGDPVDENKPRIDEGTGINIVTDVRLKRTVRDYLHDFRQQEIFVRGIPDENDKTKLKTKEDRYAEFGSPNEIIKKCVDIRLFGGTFALKSGKKKGEKSGNEESPETEEGKAFSITGPVQFKFGRSVHKVGLAYVKGTTVMPSGKGKEQGTFTERYILPYSLIVFYGIVNENAAINQSIPLSQEDVDLMVEAIWNGTKNLISGSKFGQIPRLLIRVEYKEPNYYLGELDKRIKFISDKKDEEIRDITEGVVDITELVDSIKDQTKAINCIYYKVDERIKLQYNGSSVHIDNNLFPDIKLEVLNF